MEAATDLVASWTQLREVSTYCVGVGYKVWALRDAKLPPALGAKRQRSMVPVPVPRLRYPVQPRTKDTKTDPQRVHLRGPEWRVPLI